MLGLSVLTSLTGVQAGTKVIYGDDNRVEPINSNALYSLLAESTAAMISTYKLEELNSDEVVIKGTTLEQMGVCSSEPFAKQPAAANCSGFLVGKNLLVTAGHCMTTQLKCDSFSWVFDYKVDYSDESEVVVDKSKIYSCKKIISQVLDMETQNDYAVIELDRDVEDREPLKLRTSGKPSVGDEIVVIGHPTGLPTKIADGASIRSVNDVYFDANLDTYGGNSGSAVFNASTGIVEGILVRGDQDYVMNSELGCRISNVIGNEAGRGEDVTLISAVLPYVKGESLLSESETVVEEVIEVETQQEVAVEVEAEVEVVPQLTMVQRFLNRIVNLFLA